LRSPTDSKTGSDGKVVNKMPHATHVILIRNIDSDMESGVAKQTQR
jgi:hypothetical protein